MAGKGQGGRKPKPTQLKVVQGTLRKDRMNKAAPTVDTGAPEAPRLLPEAARVYYDDLVAILDPLKLLSPSYGHMLSMLAMRLMEIDEATKLIEEQGAVYESNRWTRDDNGKMYCTPMKKGNPAVAQRSEAMRHAQSLLAEFGLSPAQVGKVTAFKDEASKSPFSAFAGGGR
jgi:P27 family predicted phage terminase small subunit